MFRYVRQRSNSSYRRVVGFWISKVGAALGLLLLSPPLPAAEEISANSEPQLRAEDVAFFESKVRPLLVTHCLECHSQGESPAEGGLRLDSRAGWQAGGELGSPIVPGKPDESLLIEAVEQKGDRLRMPPDTRLSAQEVAILREWIARGAPDPRNTTLDANSPVLPAKAPIDPVAGRQFWAFRPIHAKVPDPRDEPWAALAVNPIDLHLMQTWRSQKLIPVDRADRATLIRRVTFDLTGLPPSPSDVEAFVNDPRADAYELLVDRLLASPRYGERWGRFWLDVARYADSNGLDENIAHGNAWRYRDYVIASWNRDKPFDQLVMEQLAGDLLPASDDASHREHLIATGFLVLGPKVLAEVDETKMEMDIIDEQVETTGRAFLGLTLGCARCHDHKFDPLSTRDYYALAGIFKSTRTMEHFKKIARWNELPIATPAERAAHDAITAKLTEQQAQLQKATAELKALTENTATAQGGSTGTSSSVGSASAERRAELERQIQTLQQQVTATQASVQELPTAMAVSDQEKPVHLPVHIRGNHLTLGDAVARRVPEVLQSDELPPPSMPEARSGRLELAQWLVHPRHPLTARVFANRLWRWHFGQGLVRSTDNFGQLGERPSHPDLLDWLASELIRNEWSIKHLQRQVVLSYAYQLQSSRPDRYATTASADFHADPWQVNEAIDPANQFFWRGPMRRLEAESIRDALLAVGQSLDYKMGGSLLHVKNREFLFDHTSKDNTRYDARVRSVYLPVIRNHLYDMFQLFDYVDDSVTNSDRATTTVAPQALFLMNGELAMEAAQHLARRITRETDDAAARIDRGYQIVYGRPARPQEQARDLAYLKRLREQLEESAASPGQVSAESDQQALTLLCQIWLASNEFLYVR